MFISNEYGLKKDTERRRSEQLKEGQREREGGKKMRTKRLV